MRAVYGVDDWHLTAWLHASDLVQIWVEVYVSILKAKSSMLWFGSMGPTPYCDKSRCRRVDNIYKLSIVFAESLVRRIKEELWT